MFDLPNAKRVCRADLESPRSSRSPSPITIETANYAANALKNVYASLDVLHPESNSAVPAPLNRDDEEEQEFEFRLFRSKTSDEQSSNIDTGGDGVEQVTKRGPALQKLKIRLRSPSPAAAGEGGFVVPFRGWDYYFSNPEAILRTFSSSNKQPVHSVPGCKSKDLQDSTIKRQFLEAAVTSEEVLAAAKSTTWPGCNLPWRVIHLPARSSAAVLPVPGCCYPIVALASLGKTKKKKPGKKRRIVLRKRVVAIVAAEVADQEKRTRRNREKKIKRRQKEREKKAALQTSINGIVSSEAVDDEP
ncbi:hypothetical protein LOZ65_005500 [Ophidiomyces ophidiicola]|nr:hypothetical protein LOZ65_005500 [Ophidiomyces ophidiicola]